MCVSCPALVHPRFIPFPFVVLLAELLEAQSEVLQLFLLLCQNFEGCHLKGCFAERLENCVQLQMNYPCPGENLGHCVQILVINSMELMWLCCWHVGDLPQVTLPLRSPLSCSLPANIQGQDCSCSTYGRQPEIQLHHGLLSRCQSRAECSSSSACTAQGSRDLAFVRANCHWGSDGMQHLLLLIK